MNFLLEENHHQITLLMKTYELFEYNFSSQVCMQYPFTCQLYESHLLPSSQCTVLAHVNLINYAAFATACLEMKGNNLYHNQIIHLSSPIRIFDREINWALSPCLRNLLQVLTSENANIT